jgi:4-hydroxy-3-methylbut-2-enyl diphosphate reductase
MWLSEKQSIGVTAGASAPDILIQQVIVALERLGANPPQELSGKPENISFSLPKELRSTP